MTPPITTHELADLLRRLDELEVKATFAEDTVEALNQVVIRQQERIEVLVREVRRLRDERLKGDEPAAPGDAPVDERPPHY